MKNLLIIFLCFSIFAAIPDDIWIHTGYGGFIEGLMVRWNWTPEQRRGVFLVLTAGKEVADLAMGGEASLVEFGAGWAGKILFDILGDVKI